MNKCIIPLNMNDTFYVTQSENLTTILFCCRSHYRDEQLFGSGQVEDVDVLVFAFAHYIAEGQEGSVERI